MYYIVHVYCMLFLLRVVEQNQVQVQCTCFTECDIVDVSVNREVMRSYTEFSTAVLITSMASYHSKNHNLLMNILDDGDSKMCTIT